MRWNAFLILEVMYFYPYAKGLRFPDTLKEAALLVCDAEHLALIVADGDRELAAKLIQAHPAFWARLIPANMSPAEQTLHSRREASLRKLAGALNRLLPASARSSPEQGYDSATTKPTDPTQADPPPFTEGPQRTTEELVPEMVPQAAPDAPTAATAAPTHEPLVGLDGEPLSPNGRRLYEAYGGFIPISPTRQQTHVAKGQQNYPQEFLQHLVELGPAVTPAHLDELVLWLWQLGFPQSLGVQDLMADGVWWWDEAYFQGKLIELFRTTLDEQERILCAAALRQSSLAEAVKDDTGQWPFGSYRWAPALQVVADAALDSDHGTLRQVLAVAVLMKYAFALRLLAGDRQYDELGQQIAAQLQTRVSHP
jgi:hypothetical protein